jgi:hypothetical protein
MSSRFADVGEAVVSSHPTDPVPPVSVGAQSSQSPHLNGETTVVADGWATADEDRSVAPVLAVAAVAVVIRAQTKPAATRVVLNMVFSSSGAVPARSSQQAPFGVLRVGSLIRHAAPRSSMGDCNLLADLDAWVSGVCKDAVVFRAWPP